MKKFLALIVVLLFLEAFGPRLTNLGIAQTSEDVDAGELLAASPHSILIESPNNHTVYGDSLILNVTVNFLKTDGIIVWQTLSSLNYSIDDKPPVSIINRTLNDAFLEPPFNSDNVTVSGLTDGVHKIAVTAVFVANVGDVFMPTYALTSDPVYFTVNKEPQPEPFPTTLAIASIIAVAAAAGLGLLVYLKKHGREAEKHEN